MNLRDNIYFLFLFLYIVKEKSVTGMGKPTNAELLLWTYKFVLLRTSNMQNYGHLDPKIVGHVLSHSLKKYCIVCRSLFSLFKKYDQWCLSWVRVLFTCVVTSYHYKYKVPKPGYQNARAEWLTNKCAKFQLKINHRPKTHKS